MEGRDAGRDTSENKIRAQLNRFESLVGYNGADRVVTWREYLKNRESSVGKSIAFSSGFSELDFFTDGFQTGELITVSGYTGMGKTLFLKSLIRSFGIGKVPVLVFSYEDAVEKYLQKFSEENGNYPVFVPCALKTGDMKWLEERVVEAKLKHNVRVVTIDHLHYLMDSEHGRENLSIKLGSIMRFLKTKIAGEHNLVVFVVAHQEKVKDNEEASMNTIRDSSLIGHESDDVIIVQRLPDSKQKKSADETFEQGFSMVKIDKARRKGTYRKRLTFQKKGHWLEQL